MVVKFTLKEFAKLFANSNNSFDYLKAVEDVYLSMNLMDFNQPKVVPLIALKQFTNILALNLEHKVIAYSFDIFNKVIAFSMASVRINGDRKSVV